MNSIVRQDITVFPADDPKKLKLGWKIIETIGIIVINDYAIQRINFGNEIYLEWEDI